MPLSLDSALAALRQGAWWAAAPQELQDFVRAAGRLRRVPAGQALFARGASPDGLYALVSGAVRITGVGAQGQETILALLEPPQWFGEIAVFDRAPRTHDAQVAQDATLVWVPQALLLDWLEDHPAAWAALGRLMAAHLRLMFAALEEQVQLPPAQRLARRLVQMAQGYGGLQGRSQRVLQVSQDELGRMLGLSRQTVNQCLQALQAQGLLHGSRGAIEVLDLARLRQAGGE
ncbi:Crp/Fnr family transcriptional regulator [Ideonella livida]|uniref:Crp/Fnr family transcriptional regulator n=1 Tax=Ideonella livida TaxID=2707176 RepID=A0A7C9PJA5_9BURK|nr:Crp/Fnr family transcriptional regulator [Ideonella livida]NDY93376.1 Crp/Fnr family transcriptional regulator [Ideonella livida]